MSGVHNSLRCDLFSDLLFLDFLWIFFALFVDVGAIVLILDKMMVISYNLRLILSLLTHY